MNDLDMVKVAAMSLEEIENLRVEVQTELSALTKTYGVIEQGYLDKQREIITLQGAKKDLEIELSKSKQAIRQLKLQVDMLTNAFWRKKNG